MSDFKLSELSRRGEELLARTRQTFNKYKNFGLDVDLLPQKMSTDGAIKLVFVGQYSAGKSSIIKMLSGIDTDIGAAITTQSAKTFNWNGLEIVDTPGIHTGIREDHDTKSYYEINHAALLIFVVTNEGFDDNIGKHFRKLAIDQERAKNMVLVVNKMDRVGNTDEKQKVITDDLRKVIAPYTPDELYLSFTDTNSYFKSQNETSDKKKEIYLRRSGCQKFVENLNAFVKSRGVLSRIQTPLETLKSEISKILEKSSTDIANEIVKFQKEKRVLEDSRTQIKTEIDDLVSNCAQQIKTEGYEVSSLIFEGAKEESIKNSLEAAKRRAEEYFKNCAARCEQLIQFIRVETNNDLQSIEDEFNKNFNITLDRGNLKSIETTASNLNTKNLNGISSVSRQLIGVKASTASQLTIPGIAGFDGFKATDLIKNAGHAFGIKFAPWGAANIIKTFSNALGWIGAAYTIYQVLDKFLGSDKEAEMQNKIRQAKENIQQGFNVAAEEARNKLIDATNDYIEKNFNVKLKDIDKKISDYQNEKDSRNDMNTILQTILKDVNLLAKDVQNLRTAKE